MPTGESRVVCSVAGTNHIMFGYSFFGNGSQGLLGGNIYQCKREPLGGGKVSRM